MIWVRIENKSRCAIDVVSTSEVDHVKKSCQYINIINVFFGRVSDWESQSRLRLTHVGARA